jgi:hypothetical protein
MAKQPLKPGTPAPASALYDIIGSRGGDTGQQRTGVEGKTLPPTPKPGQTYKIAERANNGAGRGR